MADWHKAAQAADIPEDEPLIVTVGERVLALYRVDEDVYATSGMCTHEAECLEGGWVEDGTVECPYHSAVFEIATGKAVGGPEANDLPVYPVRLEDGAVMVDLAGVD